MTRNIALFFVALATSFLASQSAFAGANNHQDVAQKLERILQGLVGRIGIAAQEIGAGE
ncbi:hypothetical protein MWU49_17220 [Alcanivorax sp. S6407]|uniref:hypothetical protein n=1 Tax=Alcanivorax sp. S6407 TaxID=2926424 RepID=UPI001FF1C14D|nr:hypothetical protein [Alcanivorax sp. S6407]MCK0155460.1 hypothetical protein [Alcanivorax sp. S6407]